MMILLLIPVVKSTAQLPTHIYSAKRLRVSIQPTLRNPSDRIENLFGIEFSTATRNSSVSFQWQTIEPTYLTGISYLPRSNHLALRHSYTTKIPHQSRKRNSLDELVVQHEQFWNRSTAALSSWTAGAGYYTTNRNHRFGGHIQVYVDRREGGDGETILMDQYIRNWCTTLTWQQRVTTQFFLTQKAIIGQHQQSNRLTYTARQEFRGIRGTTFSLDVEYNRLSGQVSSEGFYFLVSAGTEFGKCFRASLITVYSEMSKKLASAATIEIKSTRHVARIEYRELRDGKLDAQISSHPFFASRILLEVRFSLRR